MVCVWPSWVRSYGGRTDIICKRGAMDKLISGSAQVEISAKDILRALVIQDWQSGAHYQHQNIAERGYREYAQGSGIFPWICGCFTLKDMHVQ